MITAVVPAVSKIGKSHRLDYVTIIKTLQLAIMQLRTILAPSLT